MNGENIRVLVVDDTVTYRKIVSEVLTTLPGVEVVGTAANGRIALDKIERLKPHVLTLDLEMPVMGGLAVLRHLKESGSEVEAIVLSGSNERGAKKTIAALELGAFDFVAKPVGGDAAKNFKKLRQELRPRIEAFARTWQIHNILHGHGPPRPLAMPAPPTTDEHGVPPRMHRLSSSGSSRIELVAVGISTGGPQALHQFLPQLPADLPVPVLVVQHMPPLFTKSLAEGLNKQCSLTVSEAIDGQAVLPGHVLIAPGGIQMKVVKGDGGQATIRLREDPPESYCRPSVDYLFRSVTRAYGPHAVGVIMTGMGKDGALGCRQMKQRGATIIAQDEASCVVFGMPSHPIQDGIVDVVAPLDEIAGEIVRRVARGVAEKAGVAGAGVPA